jgi:hypothetical protein
MSQEYEVYSGARGYKAYRRLKAAHTGPGGVAAIWGPRRWTPTRAINALRRADEGRTWRQRWSRHKARRARKAVERSRA